MKTQYKNHFHKLHLSKQRGFSLVELMVGLVIGLLMSLVVFNTLSVNEGRKRTTNTLNDINQAGSYAIYQLDKLLRSAGSGFTGGAEYGGADYTFGCELNMALSSTQLTPATTAFPAPFDDATVGTQIRVAPVVIYDEAAGTGGDVIVTMAGSGGLSEIPTRFTAVATAGKLELLNHAGVRASDIVLISEPVAAAEPCLIQQVASTFTPVASGSLVSLAGNYYSATINGQSVTDFTTDSQVSNLGHAPSFNMLAVGAHNRLMKYDLMQNRQPTLATANPNPGIFVEGVYQMQALYGVDTALTALAWVEPTGLYSSANLLDGTPAAKDRLKSIKAIKIGVVMRTDLQERDVVSTATLRLFEDTDHPVTVNLDPTTFRYRSFEAVIPVRNSLMLKE